MQSSGKYYETLDLIPNQLFLSDCILLLIYGFLLRNDFGYNTILFILTSLKIGNFLLIVWIGDV